MISGSALLVVALGTAPNLVSVWSRRQAVRGDGADRGGAAGRALGLPEGEAAALHRGKNLEHFHTGGDFSPENYEQVWRVWRSFEKTPFLTGKRGIGPTGVFISLLKPGDVTALCDITRFISLLARLPHWKSLKDGLFSFLTLGIRIFT